MKNRLMALVIPVIIIAAVPSPGMASAYEEYLFEVKIIEIVKPPYKNSRVSAFVLPAKFKIIKMIEDRTSYPHVKERYINKVMEKDIILPSGCDAAAVKKGVNIKVKFSSASGISDVIWKWEKWELVE